MADLDADPTPSLRRWIASAVSLTAAAIAIFAFVTGKYSIGDTLTAARRFLHSTSLLRPSSKSAQVVEASPPTFAVAEGVCPVEAGCYFVDWKVVKTTQLYERPEPRDPSPSFIVSPGEIVRGVTSQVLTTTIGRVRVTRTMGNRAVEDPFTVRAGEELNVYYYLGEGCFRTWYHSGLRDLWAYPGFVDRLVLGSSGASRLTVFELHG